MNAYHISLLRLTWRDIALVIVLTVISVTGRAAEEETKPPKTVKAPFAFTQTGVYAIDWEQKVEQRIEITSADGKEHKVKVRPGDFGFRNVKGGAVEATKVITIQPQSGVVTAESSLFLTIGVSREEKIKPGVYAGSIIAAGDDETSKGTVVRLQAQVTVPDVQPLANKLTINIYRSFPFTDCWSCDDCRLPLKNATAVEGSLLSTNVPLGSLINEKGGVASVWWSGQIAGDPGGPLELPIKIKGVDHAGKYEGSIRVNPLDATDAGKVALIVNASDCILWPIVVAGLGIVLTLGTKRYIGVNRTIWKLKEQEAALGRRFKESKRQFAEASKNQSYRAYSISASLQDKRRDIVRDINALQNSATLNIETNDSDYVLIRESLKQLEDQIAAWATFAEGLKKLERDLSLPAFGAPPPGFEGTEPALLSGYKALLQGEKLSLEDFESKRKKLATSSAGLAILSDLRTRIFRDRKLLERLDASPESLNESQLQRLNEARDQLAATWDKLWRATAAEEVAALGGPDSDLESAHITLIQLTSFLSKDKGLSPPADVMSELELGQAESDTAASRAIRDLLFEVPADDAGREEFYADAVQRWDWILALIAFVIAVLTGLNTYYFGQPFGTLKDYVGLFLWAVGTKVVVDTISTALQWVFSNKVAGRLSA